MICLNTQQQTLEYQNCSFILKYLLSSKSRDIHAEPNLVLTDRWSATPLSLPFLSIIAKSNSWRSKPHLISLGLESCLEKRFLRAAWSVCTIIFEPKMYDLNLSQA